MVRKATQAEAAASEQAEVGTSGVVAASPASDSKKILSKGDILRGGMKAVRVTEVPLIGGTVRYRPLSAAAVLGFMELGKDDTLSELDRGIVRVTRMVDLLSKTLVDENNDLIFTAEELREAPADTLTAILNAVTSMPMGSGGEEGNA